MTRYFIQAGRTDVLLIDINVQGRDCTLHLPREAISTAFGASADVLPLIDAVRQNASSIERLAAAKAIGGASDIFLTKYDLAPAQDSMEKP